MSPLPHVKEILVKGSLCVELQKTHKKSSAQQTWQPQPSQRGQASRPHCRFLSLGWSELERERTNL